MTKINRMKVLCIVKVKNHLQIKKCRELKTQMVLGWKLSKDIMKVFKIENDIVDVKFETFAVVRRL